MAQALAEDANYLKEVRNQYEHYPYPPRDPVIAKTVFYYAPQDALDCMNYYHFGGKRDFTKDFRVLTAGGGTGDTVIMLAEQLRDIKADVVYLDMCEASMRVAQERAKVRHLTNITWVHGSLLDAAKLLKGKFDYIECGGVLHHLESPEAGLAALNSVLKDDGVMGLMLYAKYGRHSIYPMQNLMRLLNRDENDMQQRVENCKTVMQHLPSYHNFRPANFTDIEKFGDVGIYDLLLHSHDVAYSVPDIYKFLATSGLKPTHFFMQNAIGNGLYKPETYLGDSMTDVLSKMSEPEKQAIAELLNGNISRHVFFAAKNAQPIPTADDTGFVPHLSMTLEKHVYGLVYNALCAVPVGHTVICQGHVEIKFLKTPYAEALFKYLDGKRTLKQMFDAVRNDILPHLPQPDDALLIAEFKPIFEAFAAQDWMFLKAPHVPTLKTVIEIQQSLK